MTCLRSCEEDDIDDSSSSCNFVWGVEFSGEALNNGKDYITNSELECCTLCDETEGVSNCDAMVGVQSLGCCICHPSACAVVLIDRSSWPSQSQFFIIDCIVILFQGLNVEDC